MKLDSPIVIFTVTMTGFIIAILLSFKLPVRQVITAPLILVGSWLMLLGLTQEPKAHEILATTPQVYMVYGGLMVTVSATYLAYINLQTVRFALLLFTVGTAITVILSYLVGARRVGRTGTGRVRWSEKPFHQVRGSSNL